MKTTLFSCPLRRFRPWTTWAVGAVVAALAVAPLGTARAQVAAKPADSFVESIGVNTHWDYPSYGQYEPSGVTYATLKRLLGESGIRYIRGASNPDVVSKHNELYATYGIRTNFLMSKRLPGPWPQPIDLNRLDAELTEIKSYNPGVVASLEGPNEYDTSHGENETDWLNKLKSYVQALHTKVRADATLHTLPLLGPSLVQASSVDLVGNLDQWIDYVSIHPYQSSRHPGTEGWDGQPSGGYGSITWQYNSYVNKMTSTGRVQATECGYGTNLYNQNEQLSEEADAKYTARMYAEFFRRGFTRTYKYELLNEDTQSPDAFSKYGLVRSDFTVKPSYLALKNLISVLSDKGEAFTPGSLEYTLTAQSGSSLDNVRQLLFQKRNGEFYLMLWQEVPSWDVHAEVDLYPAAQNVTLSLPSNISSATKYELDNGGNLSTSAVSLSNNAVTLAVPDRLMLIKLVPGTSPVTLRPADTPTDTVAGVRYQYYEASGLSRLPDFGTLTPVASGTGSRFDLSPRQRQDDFAFRYTGYVRVPADGIYTFSTNSDDGSRLYIGTQLVVDNDGLHAAQERSGTIGLKAGLHAITVTFFERGGGQVLDVSYAGPGLSKQLIPVTALLHVPAAPGLVSGATYRLVARHSRQALDVSGASLDDAAPTLQWPVKPAGEDANQRWQVTAVGSDYYKLIAQHSGKALDVAGASTASGVQVQQYADNGTPAQRWRIEPTDSGYYKLTAECSGKVLTVSGTSLVNGAQVQQADDTNGRSQQWKLELLSSPSPNASRSAAAGEPAAAARTVRELAVFPNPATSAYTVRYVAAEAQKARLTVTNLLGQTVHSQLIELHPGVNELMLNAASLRSGMHMVQLAAPGLHLTQRLQVSR